MNNMEEKECSVCKHTMEELSIEITYGCIMDCIHCSSRAGAKNDIFIPVEKILEMIDKCQKHCGTTDVSLSGGEPFEHQCFWGIMSYIKGKGLKSIVYSCGIQATKMTSGEIKYEPFSDSRVELLRRCCDVLIISLHGTPETHNKIMNIGDEAYKNALETIKKCVKAGIRVETHFVPTTVNYKDLVEIFTICSQIGVSKISVLRYVPQGRGLENEENGSRLNLTKEEFMDLNCDMRMLKSMSGKDGMAEFRAGIPSDFTFLIDYIAGDDDAKKPRACTGGRTKILVKADGKVQVCPAWKELDHLSAGDIYKEDIVDIWKNGNTYVKFREFMPSDLKEPCKSCKFMSSCIGGCTAQRILAGDSTLQAIYKTFPDPLCFLDLAEEERKILKKQ